MTREVRIGLVALVGLGALVFTLLLVGSQGELRPELRQKPVTEVLDGAAPADRFERQELRIVGWYAELSGDCVGESAAGDPEVAWLERECPLRVLLPSQPSASVSQARLEAEGLRLAAPTGRPFPARAFAGGVNTRLEPLVFIGHFDDPAAAACRPSVIERCRNTFVVSDYDGLVR
jgi:hypothetical protein